MEAVVLAAGEGTRLRPLTSTRPKPMLPVAGKSILEWSLRALEGNGFSRVHLVVGYRQDVIKEYFGRRYGKLKIRYVEQREQLGTANAVSVARDAVKDDFLVMNGDVYVNRKFIKSAVAAHRKLKAKATMAVVEVQNPSEFGIVEVKRNRVKSLVEKPVRSKSNLANAGVYVFNPLIFDYIDSIKKSKRLEYEITDALRLMLRKERVCAVKSEGQWIDIGRPWNLLDANEIVMKKMKLSVSEKATVEDYTVLKGRVGVGDKSVIRSGAYIEGPVYIGRNCVIGPNCFIRPYTVIMDGCKVGNAVEVKNSIIMSDTHVGHLSYLGDSIIGVGCNFGAGTKIANLRFDDDEVKIEVRDKMVKSGRRKFGCLMGDNVKTGINVSIMPGRSIYPNAYVDAGSVVKNTIYS